MKIERRKFRIGELAKQLNVERFVIRFWEREFKVKPTRSAGMQRFYNEQDLKIFSAIKKLLYEEGFTIAGAKKQLKSPSLKKAKIVASKKTTLQTPVDANTLTEREKQLALQIIELKKQLCKLKELL